MSRVNEGHPEGIPILLEMLTAEEVHLTALVNEYRIAKAKRDEALREGGHLAAAISHLTAYLAERGDRPEAPFVQEGD